VLPYGRAGALLLAARGAILIAGCAGGLISAPCRPMLAVHDLPIAVELIAILAGVDVALDHRVFETLMLVRVRLSPHALNSVLI
jgi:hypothetical protein